jgi:hypothetical protein
MKNPQDFKNNCDYSPLNNVSYTVYMDRRAAIEISSVKNRSSFADLVNRLTRRKLP